MSDPFTAPGTPAPKTNKILIGCLAAGVICGCGGVVLAGVAFVFVGGQNFAKFECKSMQSEAKAELKGLHVAEKAFYAEYGSYTSDLVSLNWTPSTSSPRYLYGFYYAGPDEDIPGVPSSHDVDRASTEDEDVIASGRYSTVNMKTKDGEALTYDDLPEDSFVEKNEFVAAAVADLKEDDFSGLDVHLIDQDGKLEHYEDDCDDE